MTSTTTVSPHPSNSEPPLISRFTIILLGAILCGMAAGRWLSPEEASMCGFAGLFAFAGYVALELVAHRQRQSWTRTMKLSAEHRLIVHAARGRDALETDANRCGNASAHHNQALAIGT